MKNKPKSNLKTLFLLKLMQQIWVWVLVTDVVWGRNGISSGPGKGGPAIWLENLKSEIWKIVSKINN